VQIFLLFLFTELDLIGKIRDKGMKSVEQLAVYARRQGASAAAWISVDQLHVDERFARMCMNPGCPSYGLSPGCPPHVMKSDAFKALLGTYQALVVFRIDSTVSSLQTRERKLIAQNIYRLAVRLEQQALEAGYVKALGFGAGSCKELFCEQDTVCRVLAGGACSFPELARSSVAGVGIDVKALCASVGWQLLWQEPRREGEQGEPVPMAFMLGLVLVG